VVQTSGGRRVLVIFAAACTRTCFGVVETSCTPVSSQVDCRMARKDMGNPLVMEGDPPIYIFSYYQSPSVENPMICWCWRSCYFHSLHKFVIHLIMGNQLPVLYGWKTDPKHTPTSLLPGLSPLHYTWKSNIVPIWALVWGLGYRLWIWQSIDMLDWHMNLPGFVYTWNEVCEGACAITIGK
jgi:hypothetical protein